MEDKGEVNNDKTVQRLRNQRQNSEQVSTIKPQTPNRLQTLPNKAKSSDKINSLKEIILLEIKAK